MKKGKQRVAAVIYTPCKPRAKSVHVQVKKKPPVHLGTAYVRVKETAPVDLGTVLVQTTT
jgi:hypothetical protein